MPWARPDYTSIQVGRLMAYLKQNGIHCTAFYPYLELSNTLGYDLYYIIADLLHPIIAEGFFANMPGSDNEIKFITECVESGELNTQQIIDVLKTCNSFIENLSRQDIWGNFSYVGFSCTFNQVLSSIALARQLKLRYPWQKIIFGGGNMSGLAGQKYLEMYDFIDCVISGPGEEALLQYLTNDIQDKVFIEGSFIPANLSILPDYDDFYYSPHLTTQNASAILTASDGCDYGGCAFCILNERKIYNQLSKEEIIEMILKTIKLYGTKYIEFADTSLPPCITSSEFSSQIEMLGLHMYGEMRASLDNQKAINLKMAGFDGLQIGIESFSTNVLRRMRKPSNALQNIYNLRILYENEIEAIYNLILDFPGTEAEELNSVIELIPSIFHIAPPKALIKFQLCRGSAVFENKDKYMIDKIMPSHLYMESLGGESEKIFPSYFDYSYKGKDLSQWFQRIDSLCRKWVDSYNPVMSTLSLKQNNGKSIISDSRIGTVIHYSLAPAEIACINACDEPAMAEDIYRDFGKTVVNYLLNKKILLYENGEILSLPVNEKRRNLPPPQPLDSYFCEDVMPKYKDIKRR
jgi:hypothetical protein